ncbi:MAG: hypothetical protein J5509_04940 [Lachnospiraceae bacterium]|nr:hypothetical protein [Lachnospiraceae bacterium]
MKKYEIENYDYGSSYILHFEDDTYALVNIENGQVIEDTPEALMTMGFWADDAMEPVSDEIIARINVIISKQ